MNLTIDINAAFQPILKNVTNALYRFLIYHGGRGGGKSWGIADCLILIALLFTKRILCTRETLESIDDSVHQLLCDRIKFWHVERFFKITNNGITCHRTGSEFKYKGLNDLRSNIIQAVKSFEGADICWIEEAQSVSYKSLKILFPTIRKEGSFFIISFNPDLEEDAAWDLIKNPRPRSFIKQLNYYDNKHCPEELLEEAEFYKLNHPDDYENIYLGNPIKRSKMAVVKYFSQENIAELEYQPEMDLHLTCDFNIGSMAWALFHKVDDVQYFFDELALEDEDTKDCALHFINRYPHHKGKIILNGDASGRSRTSNCKKSNYVVLDEILTAHGYKVEWEMPLSNANVQHRIDSFNHRILTIQGERKIYFDPKCTHCIECCKTIKYDEKGNIIEPSLTQIQNGADKWARHFLDTISYPSVYYFPLGY